MKEILRSWTLSEVHSLRLALSAANITTVIRGEELGGVLGNPFSLWVVRDEELPSAREILRELEAGR